MVSGECATATLASMKMLRIAVLYNFSLRIFELRSLNVEMPCRLLSTALTGQTQVRRFLMRNDIQQEQTNIR